VEGVGIEKGGFRKKDSRDPVGGGGVTGDAERVREGDGDKGEE